MLVHFRLFIVYVRTTLLLLGVIKDNNSALLDYVGRCNNNNISDPS